MDGTVRWCHSICILTVLVIISKACIGQADRIVLIGSDYTAP